MTDGLRPYSPLSTFGPGAGVEFFFGSKRVAGRVAGDQVNVPPENLELGSLVRFQECLDFLGMKEKLEGSTLVDNICIP